MKIFGVKLIGCRAQCSSAHFKEKFLKVERTKSRGRKTEG